MDFDALVHAHKDAVYRQLLRICHNREDAEDVLIEALTKAYRSKDELRHPEAFQSWLAQIARRTYIRMRKQASLHPMLDLDSLTPGAPSLRSHATAPDQAAFEEELEIHLLGALASIPPVYAEIYTLHDIEEFTAAECAGRLSISLPAVKSRLHRAREMVRQRLDHVIHPAGQQ